MHASFPKPFRRSMRAVFCAILLLLALAAPLPGRAADVQEDPLTRRELDIAKDLRCTVCQNQSVAESNADLARDMRQVIREQVRAGKSRDEIVNYFVARYGDYVLMKPPADREGLPLWLAPPLVLGAIGVIGWLFLRRRAHATLPPAPSLSPEDEARVRAARHQDDLT